MNQQKTIKLKYKPQEKQTLAHIATERYVLAGGSYRGGKSAWLTGEAIQLSLETPNNVGILLRQKLTDFKRTTLLTLQEFLPEEIIEQHHQTDHYYKLKNGSTIFYAGLGDDDAGKSLIHSMSLGWFGVDQAEEISESHFDTLCSRFSLMVPGVRYRGLLTANPAPGWVRNRFIEQKLPDHIFIQMLPKDNKYKPADYEERLREQWKNSPELIARYLDGDWDVENLSNYLFAQTYIRAATKTSMPEEGLKVLGVDVARFGPDESVAILVHGRKVMNVQAWQGLDAMASADRIGNIIETVKPDVTNVDEINIGGPIMDRLRRMGYRVNGVNVALPAKRTDLYVSLKAEIYFNLQQMFEHGEISIPDHPKLTQQLASIKYDYATDGRRRIISKQQMRKEEGDPSPDYVDALVLAMFNKPEPREFSLRPLTSNIVRF